MFDLKNIINSVILGDCLEVMKKIPDDSFDMAFADPPFNLNKKYNNYKDSKGFEAYINWCNSWIREMVRITKPTGSILIHNIPKWLTYFSNILNRVAFFRHWISWNSGGAPVGKTLLPNHYGILFYTKTADYNFKFFDIRSPHSICRVCKSFLKDYGGKKDQMHPYGPLISDVWTDIHRIRHRKRRDEHPCQLPIPLLERLILLSTDEGDIVFDPFMGTGTTAVAAKRLGREFIGVEIDSNYVEISNRNIEKACETKIGNCYVSIYLNKIKTIRDTDFEQIYELGFLKNNNSYLKKGSKIKGKKLNVFKN
ncbi:MAG TPA: site-specific DNA-methyltransferase [Anaerolineae bacterium]|nr:site-specific DNA-methyltransferase [Anaerolineae bacterium]